MPNAPNPTGDTPITRTTQDACQGETSGRMRMVLGISLFVAILAVVGLAFDWHEARNTSRPAMPAATNAQPNAPQQHDNQGN